MGSYELEKVVHREPCIIHPASSNAECYITIQHCQNQEIDIDAIITRPYT